MDRAIRTRIKTTVAVYGVHALDDLSGPSGRSISKPRTCDSYVGCVWSQNIPSQNDPAEGAEVAQRLRLLFVLRKGAAVSHISGRDGYRIQQLYK